jgi:hypothetical protein
VALAELLAECMSLNLGLAAGHIRAALAPPAVGTKFAMYPACPRPELVWGLRAHTDAGGIVIMLRLRNTDMAGKMRIPCRIRMRYGRDMVGIRIHNVSAYPFLFGLETHERKRFGPVDSIRPSPTG